ncbi:MAG: YwqJ-related putative deaminase [Polyangiaceae bacterium]|nr:YwqJ-related putative deaminase [Polyangiaceae bacterium]
MASEHDAVGHCAALVFEDPRGATQRRATCTYDLSGGETTRFFAEGGGLEQARDAHGNVRRASVFGRGTDTSRPGRLSWLGARDASETLCFDYQWSPGDELQTLSDRAGGARVYAYDGRGRVAQKRDAKRGRSEDYALSPRGDVRQINGRPRSHLAGGRLASTGGASLTYDARGRLVQKTEGGAETTYDWNVLGLLTGVTLPDDTRLEFVSDGFARRLEKRSWRGQEVVRHRYLWDGDDLVEDTVERCALAARDAATFTLTERRRYAYASHSPVPLAQAIDTAAGPGSWTYFVHRDGAPIPRALVDAAGTVEEVFETEAYGRVTAGNASAPLSRFPGHWYDPETGLHYNRWRYFDPSSATYLSPEPLGLEGGLERYGYVSGRPLALIDADGLMGSKITSRRLPRSQGGGTPEFNGDSASVRNPDGRNNPRPLHDLHPAVAAALSQDSGRGVDRGDPSWCSEPHALSNYLREYEARNKVEGDPGTPNGQRNLRRAVRRMGPVGSTDNGGVPCAPCQNCSQMLARLHAIAGTGQRPATIAAAPPKSTVPHNFRPAAKGSPLDRARQKEAQGNSGALDDARRANATRYQKQLEADRAAKRNQFSDEEIRRRTARVAGMTPGVFGGTGVDTDWTPT